MAKKDYEIISPETGISYLRSLMTERTVREEKESFNEIRSFVIDMEDEIKSLVYRLNEKTKEHDEVINKLESIVINSVLSDREKIGAVSVLLLTKRVIGDYIS